MNHTIEQKNSYKLSYITSSYIDKLTHMFKVIIEKIGKLFNKKNRQKKLQLSWSVAITIEKYRSMRRPIINSEFKPIFFLFLVYKGQLNYVNNC